MAQGNWTAQAANARINDEVERQQRATPLVNKRLRGETWTSEECEEAIACGLATRQDVDAFHALLKRLTDSGYEPFLRGGIDCDGVLISKLPRTPDGGYVVPCLLKGVLYRGNGMDFFDLEAPQDRQLVQWIGQHKKTGQLVARTDAPTESRLAEYAVAWIK